MRKIRRVFRLVILLRFGFDVLLLLWVRLCRCTLDRHLQTLFRCKVFSFSGKCGEKVSEAEEDKKSVKKWTRGGWLRVLNGRGLEDVEDLQDWSFIYFCCLIVVLTISLDCIILTTCR